MSRAEVVLGEDYVQGAVGSTDVAFSEVILYTSETASGNIPVWGTSEQEKNQVRKVQRMMNKSGEEAGGAPFFRGLYLVADFHKHFRGHTVVRPTDGTADSDERLVVETESSPGRLEQIHLEDVELEGLYNVYGTDQQQARYILSTSMMERVKAFRERMGKTVSVSFHESNMQVAVPYERDLLEVGEVPAAEILDIAKSGTDLDENDRDLRAGLVDREQVFTYFKDLQFILGIVEDFDLNTRIWLKE